jgi:hypothetical protein
MRLYGIDPIQSCRSLLETVKSFSLKQLDKLSSMIMRKVAEDELLEIIISI